MVRARAPKKLSCMRCSSHPLLRVVPCVSCRPLVTVGMYTYVPILYRVLGINAVSFGWNSWLIFRQESSASSSSSSSSAPALLERTDAVEGDRIGTPIVGAPKKEA